MITAKVWSYLETLTVVVGILGGGFFGYEAGVNRYAQSVSRVEAAVKVVPEDPTTTVSCVSNSMGLTVHCNDIIYKDEVLYLKEGGIYVFKNPYNGTNNATAIHRLIACVTIDDKLVPCNDSSVRKVLFKGDANSYTDPLVNISDVYYKVKKVEYR